MIETYRNLHFIDFPLSHTPNMLVSSELNLTECLFMYETLSFSIKTKAITSFSDYKSRRSNPVIYEQLSFRVDELAKDKLVWSV